MIEIPYTTDVEKARTVFEGYHEYFQGLDELNGRFLSMDKTCNIGCQFFKQRRYDEKARQEEGIRLYSRLDGIASRGWVLAGPEEL